MYLSGDDVYIPSITSVETHADFNFFAPTINSLFGEELIWLNNDFDWLKSEDSTIVLNGGNPAVGIAAGVKSFVYTEGLEKTVIAKSSELDVHAINGDLSLVFDDSETDNLMIIAENANVSLIDVSSEGLNLNNFEVRENVLVYDTDEKSITFELNAGSEVNVHTLGDLATLEIVFRENSYQIKNGSDQVSLESSGISDNFIINSKFEDNTFSENTEVNSIQSGIDGNNDLLADLLSSDDIEVYEGLENIYNDLEALNLAPKQTVLETLSAQTNEEGIKQLLSDQQDDLVFDVSDEPIHSVEMELEKLDQGNEHFLDSALSVDNLADHVFTSAIEFYDEI